MAIDTTDLKHLDFDQLSAVLGVQVMKLKRMEAELAAQSRYCLDLAGECSRRGKPLAIVVGRERPVAVPLTVREDGAAFFEMPIQFQEGDFFWVPPCDSLCEEIA